MKINRLDHLVLTVASIEKSCDFYSRVLGMEVVIFDGGRKALKFGNQKINLHECGHEVKPNAKNAGSGTADLCFICDTPLEAVKTHLLNNSIVPESDIVEQIGAIGKIRSIYIRDPDENLVELSNY